MAIATTVTVPLISPLANGWRIKGHTQGLGYQFTNPASAIDTSYGGWWSLLPNLRALLAGHVLFFWVDFNPPIGKQYAFPPFVRETWLEKTYTEAELNALFGATVVVGQQVGFRVVSFLGLAGGYTTVPSPFIELEADATIVRFFPSGSWNIFTLPPGGHPNIQEAFFQLPLGASKSITFRIGARNLAPSLNLSWTIDSIEFALYVEPGQPEPPAPMPPPLIPDICSTYDILYRAQEETGYEFDSTSEAAEKLWQYAKSLLSRCMASWYGNEVGTAGDPIIDISTTPAVGGFGFNFGFDFGVGGSPTPGASLAFAIPNLEAIWRVEARRTATQQWEPVAIVQRDDKAAGRAPRAYIGDAAITLIDWNTVWLGIYDRVRLLATAVHPTPGTFQESLAPNDHIGPLFCRACELEMSHYLAFLNRDFAQVRALGAELRSVTTTLMNQGRSQGWIESSRWGRR